MVLILEFDASLKNSILCLANLIISMLQQGAFWLISHAIGGGSWNWSE